MSVSSTAGEADATTTDGGRMLERCDPVGDEERRCVRDRCGEASVNDGGVFVEWTGLPGTPEPFTAAGSSSASSATATKLTKGGAAVGERNAGVCSEVSV